MLTPLSNDELKERGRWKHDTTVYTYVQSAISLIVPVAVKPSRIKLLHGINNNIAKFFQVPKVSTGWGETLAEL